MIKCYGSLAWALGAAESVWTADLCGLRLAWVVGSSGRRAGRGGRTPVVLPVAVLDGAGQLGVGVAPVGGVAHDHAVVVVPLVLIGGPVVEI